MDHVLRAETSLIYGRLTWLWKSMFGRRRAHRQWRDDVRILEALCRDNARAQSLSRKNSTPSLLPNRHVRRVCCVVGQGDREHKGHEVAKSAAVTRVRRRRPCLQLPRHHEFRFSSRSFESSRLLYYYKCMLRTWTVCRRSDSFLRSTAGPPKPLRNTEHAWQDPEEKVGKTKCKHHLALHAYIPFNIKNI